MPYAKEKGKGTRKEIGYVLCHQGDNPVVRLLPEGRRVVIRSGHVNVLEKSPAIVKLIEDGITGAKRQRFNDLISEIQDFYDSEEEPQQVPVRSYLLDPVPTDKTETTAQPAQDEHAEDPTHHSSNDIQLIEPQIPHPDALESTAPAEELTRNNTDIPESMPHEQSLAEPQGPRRSTRSGAQKPAGFYSKLNKGENVADYTACHMRAHECSTLYGAQETERAGATEVINMIKVRGAAEPVDYRKLSHRVISEALPSFLFFKAKDILPGENHETEDETHSDLKDEDEEASVASTTKWTKVRSKRAKRKRGSKKKRRKENLRGRWVGGGNKQEKGEVLAERVAPTARGTTHSLIMGIAAFEGRKLRVGDIPSAYLQADHVPANGRTVYIVADRYVTGLIVKHLPEYRGFTRPNGTMILKVKKAMYGLVESAWLWYEEFKKQLISIGYNVSLNDRGLFYKKIMRNGACVASNLASVHVDDIISAASPNKEGEALDREFWSFLESKWPGIKMQYGPHYKHLSWNVHQDHKTGEIRKSQRDYLLELVKSSGVTKERSMPCRSNLTESDPSSNKLSPIEANKFRSTLQKIAYAREGRPDFDFTVCYLQSKQSAPSEQDRDDLLHLLGYVMRFPEKQVIFKPKDLQLRGHADASFNITIDGRSYYGYLITLGGSLVSTKGGRIKTIVRSSTEAEITAVNEIVSELLWCRDIMEELGYEQKKMPILEDNQSCITMLQKEPRSFHSKSRHVRVKWAFFRQEYNKRTLCLCYCPTEKMTADILTKPLGGKAHKLHSTAIFSGSEP